MEIGVVTLLPEMFEAMRGIGVTGRAIAHEVCAVSTWNPRDFTNDKHRTVDDSSYGGGPGMVMKYAPLKGALSACRSKLSAAATVVLLSPQGQRLDQSQVAELAGMQRLILIAGRYEGIDERFIQAEVQREVSIGDYILSGGELAAAVLIDAIVRLLPGVLGNDESAAQDSFSKRLLDHPHYTRPEEIDGYRVPEPLLGGNHQAIERWRRKQALGRTWLRRPDLLVSAVLGADDRTLLDEFAVEYAAASGPDS